SATSRGTTAGSAATPPRRTGPAACTFANSWSATSVADQPLAIARAAVIAGGLDPATVPGLRTRMRWTLFAISALGSTGYIAAITVGTLVATQIHGDATLGGVPTAAATIGTATAAGFLSGLMLRVGRRNGLIGGLLVG